MLHGEPKLGIMGAGALAGRVRRHDHEAPVDLLPVVHPGCILLAHIAALGKADAVQLGGVAFEPERLVGAELRPSLSDAEAETMLEPPSRSPFALGGEPPIS